MKSKIPPNMQALQNQIISLVRESQDDILRAIQSADLREIFTLGDRLITALKNQSDVVDIETFKSARALVADTIANHMVSGGKGGNNIFQEASKATLSALINSLFDTLAADMKKPLRQYRRQLAFENNHLFFEQLNFSVKIPATQNHLLATLFKNKDTDISFQGDHKTGDGTLSIAVKQTNFNLTHTPPTYECLAEAHRLEVLAQDIKGDHRGVLLIALTYLRNQYLTLAETAPNQKALEEQREKSNAMLRDLYAAIFSHHTDSESKEEASTKEVVENFIKSMIGNEAVERNNLNAIKTYLTNHIEGGRAITLNKSYCPRRKASLTSPRSKKAIKTAISLEAKWNKNKVIIESKMREKIQEGLDAMKANGGLQENIAENIVGSIDELLEGAISEISVFMHRLSDNASEYDQNKNSRTEKAYLAPKEWGKTLNNIFGDLIISEVNDGSSTSLFAIHPAAPAIRRVDLDENQFIDKTLNYFSSLDVKKRRLIKGPSMPDMDNRLFQIEVCIKYLLIHFMTSPESDELTRKTQDALERAIKEIEQCNRARRSLGFLRDLTNNLPDIAHCMISAEGQKILLSMKASRMDKRIQFLMGLDDEEKANNESYGKEYASIHLEKVRTNHKLEEIEPDNKLLLSLPNRLHEFYCIPTELKESSNAIGGLLLGLAAASAAGSTFAHIYLISSITWVLPTITWGLASVAILATFAAAYLLVENNFKRSGRAREKFTSINKRIADAIADIETESNLPHTQEADPIQANNLSNETLLQNNYALLAQDIEKQRFCFFGNQHTNSSRILANKMIQAMNEPGEPESKKKSFAKELVYHFVRILLANGRRELPLFKKLNDKTSDHDNAKAFAEDPNNYQLDNLCLLTKEVRDTYIETQRSLEEEKALRATANPDN